MRSLPDSAATFTYDIDPEAGVALARMHGALDGRAMLAILEAVHRDPRWQPGFDAIWDCTDVSGHAVRPSDVPPIVDEAVEGEKGRDVMVERGSVIDSAISMLIAAYCRRRGKPVTVVRTLDAALAELGRDALPEALAVRVGSE